MTHDADSAAARWAAPRRAPGEPLPTYARTRLARALDGACAHHDDDAMAALRAAVTGFVDGAKARGASLRDVAAATDALTAAPSLAPLQPRLREWCRRAYLDDAWW